MMLLSLFAHILTAAHLVPQVESFAPLSQSPLFASSLKKPIIGDGDTKRSTVPVPLGKVRVKLHTVLPSSLQKTADIGTHVHSNSAQNVSAIREPDSLLQFSNDIKKVLHELRASTIDPTIPEYIRQTSSQLTYSKTWTLDDWEKQYSRKRYLRYLFYFPKSRVLRRIAPQQTALLIWTLVSIWIEDQLVLKSKVSITALGTISTFLAFLLTLRSNQGLSRLDEGRRIWSKVVLYTREMSQLISAFIYPVDKQLALMLARHVAIFGWLLKSELRLTAREDVADIVRTVLPNKADSDYVLSQRQKANAVVSRIRQVIHHLAKDHRLSTAEEIALDHTAQTLSEIITSTGRIRATPIPTQYTSHASRLLCFYLVCLPPALYCSGLDRLMTTIITFVVGYAMIGLDELSHLFEFPFRVIPMYQICKRSMLGVADAITCRPPPLIGEKHCYDEDSKVSQKDLTTYWNDNEGIIQY